MYEGLQPYKQQTVADQIAWALSRIRSSRILKPRSASNSPHSAVRRRTTISHGSVPQYRQRQSQVYRAPIEDALLASAVYQQCRPMSWHPTSQQPVVYNNMGRATYPPPTNDISQALQPALPSSNGLENLSSYPISGESMPITDFSGLQLYEAASGTPQSNFPQMNASPIDTMSWDMSSSTFPCISQDPSQGWALDGVSMADGMPSSYIPDFGQESVQSSDDFTGPPTPDFLPIQQFPDASASCPDLTSKSESSADELVGVGLYDEPDTSLADNSMLGGFNEVQGSKGKGLKLEETFTPTSDDEEDDGEDETEGDENTQGYRGNEAGTQRTETQHSEQEREIVDQSLNAATTMLGKSFLFDEPEDMMATSIPECPQMMGTLEIPCSNLGYGWI